MKGIFEMKSCFSWLLLISLLCILSNENEAISSDGEALLSFRNAVSGSDSFIRQWRPEDPDPCKWNGVTCDVKTKRVITLNLTYHKLSGLLHPELGKLDHLRLLMLHNNGLYGPIPSTLRNCTALEGIYLQSNYLSGPIPAEMGDLHVLQNLDMSSNSLSGSIPASFRQLKKLTNFNVSNNFLVGQIPSRGVLSGFSKNSFIGNLKLCGKQIDVICKDNSGKPSSNSHLTGKTTIMYPSNFLVNMFCSAALPAKLYVFGVSYIIGQKKNSGKLLISASATVGALLLVALMCFWGSFLYKKLGKAENKSLAMDVGGGASIVMFHGDLPYSSKDIIKKLEMLNEEHIIGCGGFGTVYKLDMDDGKVFALKRILKLNEGFDRFFERELEILGSIKHRYLVNLRGYCNSPTSKLLLYDYLPGGSLDESLYERGEQLDWDSRVNIIIGAAKGLSYLHHDCSPRIIHRDIKSSNILLDGNLEARVSDFGLAKLLEDEESHITTIVAGTFGYLAPEYMQSGRATEKTDVYSFGVLVLEVLSGKRPTDASFIEKGLNVVGWLKFLISEKRPREIVDQNCEGMQIGSLDALLSIATQCVSSVPEERPTMHRVVQLLESEVMTPCPSDFYDSSSD
ncbi:unnamed protein product [Cochlearia groenlandica]